MPTSSSSSSFSSSSSSSSSFLYSSSSSSGWCKFPSCYGNYCSHFSDWQINGIHDSNQIEQLYVVLNSFSGEQQIEIYSDYGYLYLAAEGRGPSGTINLNAVNDSGITGSAYWDGVAIPTGSLLILDCEDVSSYTSNTSSSSLDSTSSSSQSLSSQSSSSSNCCINPYHEGNADSHFGGISGEWTFSGMTDKNSSNCSLYAGLDVVSGYQIVRIYKNSSLINLVAIGQRNTAGIITLSSVSSSGLTGSVYCDGVSVLHPSIINLSCAEMSSSSSSSSSSSLSSSSSSLDSSSSSSFDSSSSSTSRSTSSSTSSIDSSSSSSSTSLEFSSSSSLSSSSESSKSMSSQSSSSSIDSSSSSSESEGNTSSSSSSSIEIWNKSKPLILANSAICSVSIKNKLSQSVYIDESTYNIGNVYAYLFGPYGNVASCTITMTFGTADDDGKPLTVLATSTISASQIDSDAWYEFPFNVSGSVPANKLLCYTMYMDGMNEDNYVMWGYSEYSGTLDKAYLLVEGEWVIHNNIIRSIKANGPNELFDLVDYKITSPPGVSVINQPELNNNTATYTNTQLLEAPERVEIKNQNTIISFVIDSSGSMGWNDRFNNRTNFITSFYNRFKDNYQYNFLFDYIKFGSISLDTDQLRSSLQQTASINLDLINPTRTTYVFDLDKEYSMARNDIYETVDGKRYTVIIGSSYVLKLYAISSEAPSTASGMLSLVSGSGDANINYTNYSSAVYSDGIIGYGIKNLTTGHNYIISNIYIDDEILDFPSLNNNNLFYPSSELPEISLLNNGPNDENAINILATNNLISRKALNASNLTATYITNDVDVGSSIVNVSNSTSIVIGAKYDLLFGDVLAPNHTVTDINEKEISVTPVVEYFVPGKDKTNSLFELAMYDSPVYPAGATLRLLIKDEQVSDITFYLQTKDGLPIEWDITPFEDWVYLNLFWLGETANLSFIGVDTDGDSLPDGTRLDLLVDSEFEDQDEEEPTTKFLTQEAIAGSDLLYLDDTKNITINSNFNLVSSSNNQDITVAEIGEDTVGKYIRIKGILYNNYDVGSKIISKTLINNPMEFSYKTRMEIPLSVADITPILAGKNLDASLLKVYDGPQVPYTTTYTELNTASQYTKNITKDIPTINGFAALRFLPITEDAFKSTFEKQEEIVELLKSEPPDKFKSQLEKSTISSASTTQEETTVVKNEDYAIETPVYFYSSKTTSTMTSYATTLEEKTFEGLNFPGETDSSVTIPSKTYKVYPQISIANEYNIIVGKQIVEPLTIDFASPIHIKFIDDGKIVNYYRENVDPSNNETCNVLVDYFGVYASSKRTIIVKYRITNKLILANNKQARIRIYTNKIIGDDALNYKQVIKCSPSIEIEDYTQETSLNVKPHATIITNENGEKTVTEYKSAIDEWRDKVSQNTNPYSLNGKRNYKTHYANPEEWTLSSEVEKNDYTENIVNGYITLALPAEDTVLLWKIEISVDINDAMEFVQSNLFLNSNPLVIGLINPSLIQPKNNEEQNELSISVKWMNGEIYDDDGNLVATDGVIENGTPVILTPTITKIEPTIGETVNNVASGYFIGPPPAYLFNVNSKDVQPIEETIYVEASAYGYVSKSTQTISWIPSYVESKDVFFIKCDSSEEYTMWTDGEEGDTITLNLQSPDNQTVIIYGDNVPMIWVGEYGSKRLMGELDQPNNTPATIYANNNVTPTYRNWNTATVSFAINGLNKSIGAYNTGEYLYVDFITAYWFYDANSIKKLATGVVSQSYPQIWTETEPPPEPYQLTSDGKMMYLPVNILLKDPLAISLEIETLNRTIIRDGSTETNIVATITWKNNYLKPTFTFNSGKSNETTIAYPLPFVSFTAGTCSQENTDLQQINPLDKRGPATACLSVRNHPDVYLSSYYIQSSLSRTDIFEDEDDNEHTHACSVDDNGNGITTSTIVLKGNVAEHSHTIVNFVALETLHHTHNLRSVAITKIKTDNQTVNLTINGSVIYDPTNALPYEGETQQNNKNRMAFNTVRQSGTTERELIFEITAGNNLKLNQISKSTTSSEVALTFYSSESIDSEDGGFDIKARAYYSAYITSLPSGQLVTIPEENVPDGTRIVFSTSVFKPPQNKFDTSDQATWISSYKKETELMYIKTQISVCVDGLYKEANLETMILSRLQWLPSCKSLVSEPTSDEIYKDTALTKIKSIGASQVYDAVALAAQRSLEYAYNNNLSGYKHIILILSDGDENLSTISYNQSINNVHFINGKKESPIIANKLGEPSIIDQTRLEKMANDTSGFITGMNNYSVPNIDSITNEIIVNDLFPLNNGIYSNIVEFVFASSPKEITLNNVTIPTGASIHFRARTSQDMLVWEDWSDWTKYDTSITQFEKLQKYVQYEVKLSGNENFASPSLNEGLLVNYIKPQSAYVYFTPVSLGVNTSEYNNDKYLSSIHITHQGSIPETSTVEYGINLNNSINPEEFKNLYRDWIKPDEYSIILTRINEALQTKNYKIYSAQNGTWSENASVAIMRFNLENPNGILVPSNEYVLTPSTGKITFTVQQPIEDSFTINITYDSSFRIICKINNYGEEAATIDHITLMYSIMQRIPRDSNGNIINKPLSKRIE